jgi:hypothetical protein
VAQNLPPHGELRVELSQCSGLLRLGTALHSHSSGLLIHRSCYSYVFSGLEAEMEFGEVKIRVWIVVSPRGDICPRTNLGCYRSLMMRSGKSC